MTNTCQLAVEELHIKNNQALDVQIRAYLSSLVQSLNSPPTKEVEKVDCEGVAEKVFAALTGREFCYLSKTSVSPYKENILALIRKALQQGEPIHFYFDIGGGYHASIQPGESALCFEVGLAELFVLSQISKFAKRIREFYPLGVRFSLVIDNMCAFLINDIPLAKTLQYCTRLRRMIRSSRMNALVDVLVESEYFSVEDFAHLRTEILEKTPLALLTRKQHKNVERFLGRRCSQEEAFERTIRYKEVSEASERLLARLIKDVRMTQRATDTTICFRPFPGGDSRIQCGEVALTRNEKGNLRPILLTSSNFHEYACRRYWFPRILLGEISSVTYAQRIAK